MLAPKMAEAVPQRYAGNGPKFERLGGVLKIQNTTLTNDDWQLLGDVAARRTVWLSRRFGLTPSMACAVASLAFGEGR